MKITATEFQRIIDALYEHEKIQLEIVKTSTCTEAALVSTGALAQISALHKRLVNFQPYIDLTSHTTIGQESRRIDIVASL